MKKNYFYLLVLLLSLVFVACDNNKPDEEFGKTSNPEKTELTASEQKQKLQTVAEELIGVFNTNDQKDVIALADYLVEKYEDYDWDDVYDFYANKFDYVKSAVEGVKKLSHGEVSANVSSKVYRFSRFTGIFKANDKTKSWEYEGDSENIVLLFKNEEGVECRAELIATGVAYAFDYEDDYDNDYDLTVEVPNMISFSLKEGDIEHISYTTTLDIEASTSVKQTTSVRFTNITLSSEATATKNSVSGSVLVKYGDRTIFEGSASAPNCKLKDKTDAQEWEDWFEMYGESLWNEDATVKYGNLVGYANILEQIQIKVAVSDLTGYYTAYDKLDEEYEDRYGSDYECYHKAWWNSYEYNKDYANLLNNYLTGIVYYSSDVEQARLQFEVDSYERYCYNYDTDDDHYADFYDVMSVIYFPKDDTSYSFEDYFTEKAFSGVIDLTEELANKYLLLFDYIDMGRIDLN